jgi:hypothetical protein
LKKQIKFVAVSGYGWSGSGAVVDLLREVEGCGTPGFEFSLIKEPRGVIDLECFLLENWDVIRHSHAIEQFLQFVDILGRPNRRWGHWGQNMNAELGIDLKTLALNYINNISLFNYRGASRIHHYEYGHAASFFRKVGRLVGFKWASGRKMYLARPTEELFLNATANFITEIFNPMFVKRKLNCIILDQAIPTSNVARGMRYFNDIKLILVDRDPRDIYVDQISNRTLIGANTKDINRVDKFITWHKTLRSNYCGANILKVRFEDLVLKYDQTSSNILRYLGLEGASREKQTLFKPEISVQNIGIWRQYHHQCEIKQIERALGVPSDAQ